MLEPSINPNSQQACVASLVLAFANVFVKPFMLLAALPVTIFTLGVFVFVINALILQLVAWAVNGVRIRSFSVALRVSLAFSFLNMLVSIMVVDSGAA